MNILRTALEDRTLRAELPGYADYAAQVRSRLLPGIWLKFRRKIGHSDKPSCERSPELSPR